EEGKDRSIPLLVEEGWREAPGWLVLAPQDHPSATLSRPALLDEEGKDRSIPLLVEDGWRAAPGWLVLVPQDHPSATLSRPALLDEEGKDRGRGGGVARSAGAVGFSAAGPPVRDVVASCPPRRGGQRPRSWRRGGAQRRGGL